MRHGVVPILWTTSHLHMMDYVQVCRCNNASILQTGGEICGLRLACLTNVTWVYAFQYGMTPLMWAVWNGHLDVIRLLLKASTYYPRLDTRTINRVRRSISFSFSLPLSLCLSVSVAVCVPHEYECHCICIFDLATSCGPTNKRIRMCRSCLSVAYSY